ncbi:16S rRNA m(2)G 1207 methyltransferase /23S rRNA m(2)G-1835 methyltransferase [Leucobacter luti]|uniref:16S rRNA m(2)G 1207 methyltransferase /23S rRNA m(2)G-1835 methyltransferase n=1 Tax=Leucobacter luti TaxID=340320 RepID=A0A4R6RUY0_9MICO|nr:methyltransferase [Leucobacter luti]TDP90743.1 16S rRNA m(2)G 1207 methyltransferase /23S rRNA m(2)G-1835 methyltransferase [Leucobacter luti]
METVAGAAALFARLSREPDFEAAELQAFDATDELLLATASDAIRTVQHGELVVLGDRHGALTLGAAQLLGATGIRVFQDPVLGELALHANAARIGLGARTEADAAAASDSGSVPAELPFSSHALDASLLSGAAVVLVQLPRGLDALEELAWAIARWARPDVRVFAGGRVKHMTHTMNTVLARHFREVAAGLGWRKSRVLTASAPIQAGPAPFPRWGGDPELDFRVAAFGATFGGPTLDHGSRLLLAGLADAAPAATRIVDLGSGNGVLAVSAARSRPDAQVIATDQSAAAVKATLETAAAAGVLAAGCGHAWTESPGSARLAGPDLAASPVPAASAAARAGVCVHRADALEAVPDGWADLILLNPPFHTGATVHAGVAHRLIAACERALAPGGELRIVFNSHLGYRHLVEQVVGQTRQVARDRTFTVLAATRAANHSERSAPKTST